MLIDLIKNEIEYLVGSEQLHTVMGFDFTGAKIAAYAGQIISS